jgi:hypothetical protein
LLTLWLLHAQWYWALLTASLGALALATTYWRFSWLASLHFLALLTVASFGAATVLSSWGTLLSVLCGLAAWDLELFARRLELFRDVPRRIGRAHLKRLALVFVLCGAAGAVALSLRWSFGFGWALLLAFGFLIAFLVLLRQGLERK